MQLYCIVTILQMESKFDTPDLPLTKQLDWKAIGELIGIESNTMVFKSLNNLPPLYNLSLKCPNCPL